MHIPAKKIEAVTHTVDRNRISAELSAIAAQEQK